MKGYVPHSYESNVSLGTWTNKQRYQYRLYERKDPTSAMTEKRIALLEEIGFEWNARVKEEGNTFDSWLKIYQKAAGAGASREGGRLA